MRHRIERSRHPARALALASLFAGAALAGSSAVRADDGLHEHVRDVLRHLGRIPERIHAEHARHLEVFSGGRAYYGPHRHHHASYLFPVWIDGAVAYRPYSYCNGHLFQPVAYRPYLWSDWGHARGGGWCDRHHGWYPKAHGCFHPSKHRHGRGHWDRGHGRHGRGHPHCGHCG